MVKSSRGKQIDHPPISPSLFKTESLMIIGLRIAWFPDWTLRFMDYKLWVAMDFQDSSIRSNDRFQRRLRTKTISNQTSIKRIADRD